MHTVRIQPKRDSVSMEADARVNIRERLTRISNEIARLENKHHMYLFEGHERELECLRAAVDRIADKY